MGGPLAKCCRCEERGGQDAQATDTLWVKDGPGLREDIFVTKDLVASEAPAAEEWNIVIDQTDRNRRLGVSVDLSNGTSLVVEAISDGLIGDWNNRHPKQAVQPGDFVVEVNGHRGDSQLITNRCVMDDLLELRISRPS
mmetsp:Transcript_42277/g.111814  ORF Transcript_42277/g.111814 Transcript_42277/m.111814 type:complete len:139 (-) Transcript_42277:142-558(-)